MSEPLAEYEDTKQGAAAYFLYYSLEKFHSFMGAFRHGIEVNTMKEGINIPKIQDDFGDKGGTDPNVAILLAGAMTIFAGFTVTQPWLVGGATVVTGSMTLVGNVGGGEPPAGTDGGSPLADKVLGTFEEIYDYINAANGAVFGIDGVDPNEHIPQEMQKQTFKNPSVKALGDGQWLVADATQGVDEYMKEMYKRMVSRTKRR